MQKTKGEVFDLEPRVEGHLGFLIWFLFPFHRSLVFENSTLMFGNLVESHHSKDKNSIVLASWLLWYRVCEVSGSLFHIEFHQQTHRQIHLTQ